MVGLVEPAYADAAVTKINASYLSLHPEAVGRAAIYLATSVKGVHFL